MQNYNDMTKDELIRTCKSYLLDIEDLEYELEDAEEEIQRLTEENKRVKNELYKTIKEKQDLEDESQKDLEWDETRETFPFRSYKPPTKYVMMFKKIKWTYSTTKTVST